MPQRQQFKKSLRKIAKARVRNNAAKSRLNTMVKNVKRAKSREEAEIAFKHAVSVIDSTARKGIIKKNTAARNKSQLNKFVAKMT